MLFVERECDTYMNVMPVLYTANVKSKTARKQLCNWFEQRQISQQYSFHSVNTDIAV